MCANKAKALTEENTSIDTGPYWNHFVNGPKSARQSELMTFCVFLIFFFLCSFLFCTRSSELILYSPHRQSNMNRPPATHTHKGWFKIIPTSALIRITDDMQSFHRRPSRGHRLLFFAISLNDLKERIKWFCCEPEFGLTEGLIVVWWWRRATVMLSMWLSHKSRMFKFLGAGYCRILGWRKKCESNGVKLRGFVSGSS